MLSLLQCFAPLCFGRRSGGSAARWGLRGSRGINLPNPPIIRGHGGGGFPPTAGGPAKIRQGGPGGNGIGGPGRRKIGRIGGPTVGRGCGER